MIGEIEALLDESVNIYEPAFSGPLARMQQHILDDSIRSFAMLHDLFEIAPQCIDISSANLTAPLFIEAYVPESFLQLINQFSGNTREIVNEIKRVLDLVRNAGGELTE